MLGEKIYHIDVGLTQKEIDKFLGESESLILRVSRTGDMPRFNTVWKVHNSIAMAKHAIEESGGD